MHVQQRMQGAGWEADLERWDTDEDSDDSEAEGDSDERAGTQLSEAMVLSLMA